MYRIGHFIFEITGIGEEQIPFNLSKFKTDELPEYHYHIDIVDDIAFDDKDYIVNKQTIRIAKNGELETRYLALPGENRFYAKCKETDETHTVISFHRDYIRYLNIDTVFNSLLSLERRMNSYKSYILHSSYIVYQEQAILFSAPSGTGKSTQADLWKKYRDIEIINGDRTLLTKEGERFYANGWPVCGSSKICHNRRYPIKAIVMLEQGPVNEIKELSGIEKTRRLLREITINYYNQEYLDSALDFIGQLIKELPVTALSCTISQEAVDILDDYLKEVVPISNGSRA
ncbi:hypothetical protein SD457_17245 [Coprobacillaceae bacterium CR2/5/TPMF4]|nr:hypothetical protein SD457_17245 [Coprobacillaceae bacterium CR2/5/TPMF4]